MIFLADAALTGFVQNISIFVVLIIALALLMKRMHQPYIIAYILVGVLLGDYGLGLIQEEETVAHLGEIGIILLMVYLTNHFVNAVILRIFGSSWKDAFVGGAFLAQIG